MVLDPAAALLHAATTAVYSTFNQKKKKKKRQGERSAQFGPSLGRWRSSSAQRICVLAVLRTHQTFNRSLSRFLRSF
jgi:hypothetical protein